MLFALASCAVLAIGQARPDAEPRAPMAFRDVSRPPDERAADLLGRLTTEEKITQLLNESPAIERLGIPAYDWWSECLHGVARAGRATVFPQAIGLGATFDPELVRRVGAAIADEARAKYNAARSDPAHQGSARYQGLTFWTPNINIDRDPRWGRGQETYGEDPYLTGTLGAALVRGLQGDDPDHIKAAACAKHFAVHSGPEPLRHGFNAKVSMQDLNETYLPAFHALVDAGVAGVMCAYNRTNDEPCCASNLLLTHYLREAWHFEGYVVSDCGAISDIHSGHHVTSTPAESAAMGVRAGVNVECGRTYGALAEALTKGLVSEKDIDAALLPALRVRARLGLFDPPGTERYRDIGPEVVNCEKHRALAREAAGKSIVLLQNRNDVLPLRKDIHGLAVVGPNAASVEALLGNYYGVSGQFVTVLEGLTAKVGPGCDVEYTQGALFNQPTKGNGGAVWMSQGKDAVVAVIGLTNLLEGEEGDALASTHGGDRADLSLPRNQIDFLRELRKGVKVPIIAVVTGGGAMDLAEVSRLADAVLLAWYPGEQGGNAVADVIFGDVNPSGRLPVTFPKSVEDLPPFEDYAMAGRTYRYMTKEPLYPFGFGLSYTTFSYGALSLDSASAPGVAANAVCTVTNSGTRDGEEVVQVYVSPPTGAAGELLHSLKHVQRVSLKAGESRTLRIPITRAMLATADERGERRVASGVYTITMGGCSRGARGHATGAAGLAWKELMVEDR